MSSLISPSTGLPENLCKPVTTASSPTTGVTSGPAPESTSPRPGSSPIEVASITPDSPAGSSDDVIMETPSDNEAPKPQQPHLPEPIPAAAGRPIQPGSLSSGAQALTMAAARQIMLDNYTPWVMSTYGDSAKTKTITTKKYSRIVALLRSLDKDLSQQPHQSQPQPPATSGDPGSVPPQTAPEPSGSEAAKFRLWVKSKGFHLGPPAGHPDFGRPHSMDILYLPTGTDKVSACLRRRRYFLTK
jgi:hypothetical protein